jgi:predicted AAA+ superfamily ATPase
VSYNPIDQNEALISAITELTSAVQKGEKKAVSFPDESNAQAFVFEPESGSLRPVEHVAAPPVDMLFGIERTKNTLIENSRRFANGFSANNALLWGARGMGKSTLVRALHNQIIAEFGAKAPSLIEIHREDIAALPTLLNVLRSSNRQFVIYCDDLSFNRPDTDFKALKSVLEGGLEGRPENVIFYATSNRRHLLPREMAEQESAIGIHPNEAMDETIALSDRFGLWLGFHAADQVDYLNMIEKYMSHFALKPEHDWKHEALEWAKTRGNRSGRTAWQYINNLAGTLGGKVKF